MKSVVGIHSTNRHEAIPYDWYPKSIGAMKSVGRMKSIGRMNAHNCQPYHICCHREACITTEDFRIIDVCIWALKCFNSLGQNSTLIISLICFSFVPHE